MRLSLAADDLIILPQKRFFVKHFFEKLLKFYELGAHRTSQCQLVFSASIGSFQGLPAGTSEVILLSQRLALKYNTTPRDSCQHFLTSFFQFLCGGGITLSGIAARCQLPRGGSFIGAGRKMHKSSPFRGSWRAAPERVRPLCTSHSKSLAYRRRVRYYILYTL